MRGVINTLLSIATLVGFIFAAVTANWGAAIVLVAGVIGLAIVFNTSWTWWFGYRRHLLQHLRFDPARGAVVSVDLLAGERPNVQAALDYLQADAQTRGPFGVERADRYSRWPRNQLQHLLTTDMITTAIEYEQVPISLGETLDCVNNALYLLYLDEEPVAVLVTRRLEVLAKTKTQARNFLRYLERIATERSPYRGQVLSVESHDRKTGDYSLSFHTVRGVSRHALVLPDGVLNIVKRNVLSVFRQMEAMARAGRGTRHGVMLHGPPGTGKTLATRYLIGTLSGVSVVLITGKLYPHLRMACKLAERLAPSLVILEDVDLVAADRTKNRQAPLLHELMDAMDGISPQSRCVFLLTTNRPEVLEPALAARPGRVDQAIYFPLPDRECRRRLFELYRQGLEASPSSWDRYLDRTEGASPAFIKEWFRRATLLALERGATGEPLPVRESDLDDALDELTRTGGPLTRRFLGFPEPVPASLAITHYAESASGKADVC
ncbi:MAG: ATP-binding protein [Gemmataceae bacterium]